MKYESVKIGNITYNIAKKGCNLTAIDGTIAIVIGANSIDSIQSNLTRNRSIAKYTEDGELEYTRSDLVYSGEMSRNPEYPVGIDQIRTGTDESGEPVYKTVEVRVPCVIVKYRLPNLSDEIASLKDRMDVSDEAFVEMVLNVLPAISGN